jgi:hypothetical protein
MMQRASIQALLDAVGRQKELFGSGGPLDQLSKARASQIENQTNDVTSLLASITKVGQNLDIRI